MSRAVHPARAGRRALRARLLAAAAAAAVGAAAPNVAQAQRAMLERVVQRTVLPNGLEVIVAENHAVPLATIEAVVKNGAFTQTPETAGLAHLYEHMIFMGNERYPDEGSMQDRAGELGAVYNATTREESVNYYLTVPADSLDGGLEFLAAALRTPLFRDDELAQEREVVIGEYDRAESTPYHWLTAGVERKLWGSAFVRKSVIGDRRAILAATPALLRAMQRRYYVPNNAALIVTGDVSAPAVFALARRHFGSWGRAPDPFAAAPIPEVPPLARDEAVVVEQPVGAVVVLLQWHGPSARLDPKSTYAADVFSDVLNQPGSAFQRRLVDGGLFQSIGVNYYTLDHVGPISISGATTPGRLREALAALEAEIVRFDDPGYYTQAELEPVKRQRITGTALGLERASGFSHTLAFWWSVADLEYYMDYVDRMAAQTPEDLRAYARRYIVGKPKVTGVLLSPEARRQLGLAAEELVGSGGAGRRDGGTRE